jgi:hypothetical protein
MKKHNARIYALAAGAGLIMAAVATAYSQDSTNSPTGDGSADQMVPAGQAFAFSVDGTVPGSYQWLRNGAAMDGQTNSILAFDSVQIGDAGYYSCNITNGADTVPTITAALQVYTMSPDLVIQVYGTPVSSSGSLGTCPGQYTGYVSFTKTLQQGWGWAPSTNTTIYTASDTTRTNTKVAFLGKYSDSGCAQTTVTVPYPAYSPAYRFTIYFTNNVPTTNYPITLSGFNP